MNTVTTISLSGRSYTLEESGYAGLKAYLDQTAKNLDGNPDKEEILKDFEIAVAEKFERYLNPSKNVITAAEIEIIINEMGPVDGAEQKESSKNDSDTEHAEFVRPKKLYRVPEGEMIGGVCTGVAEYFNFDVTLVRLIFVILAILTHGAWILVYFVMMVILPVAYTPSEKAQASGRPTINVQELLKKAKDGYSNFKNSKEWKRWKHQMKEERNKWKHHRRHSYAYHRPSPFLELLQSLLGLVWFAFIIFLCWFGYNHVGLVHQTFDTIGMIWQHFIEKVANKFQS